jgi:Tol biopolymer transport system component
VVSTGDRLLYLSTKDHNGQTCGIDECWANAEVYVMAADGTGQTRLTHSRQTGESSPTWSPTGAAIAYAHPADTAGTAIIIARADGACPTRITALGGHDETPAWQPGTTQDATTATVCAAPGRIAT